MECLIDYIGIRGCSNTTSVSGVFINDFLMGLEWKQIDQIADSDQVSFIGVWNDVQLRASARFRTDVNVALQNKFGANGYNSGYKLKQIAQSHNLGTTIASTSFGALNENRGFKIKISDYSSNFSSIYIQSLNLYATALVPYIISIVDIKTGLTLDSITYTPTALNDFNEIIVEKTYNAKEISVTYNATSVSSKSLPLDKLNYYNGSCDCVCVNSNSCEAIINGYKNNAISDDLYGLSAVFTIKCSWDAIVCNNKAHFLTSWAYCLGAELMSERIYSSRINRWTTIDKTRAIDLRKEFEARYVGGTINETKYAGDLNNAVYGLSINQNDCCIECDAPITFKNTYL